MRDFERFIEEIFAVARAIPAEKRAFVRGAIAAAWNDKTRSRDAQVRIIADLAHVDPSVVDKCL